MTTTTQSIRRLAPLEAVLVANAARARLFERDPENGALREIASFVHPQARLKGAALGRDRPGQAFKGEARTAYEPHTDLHQKEQALFARELAQRLETEAVERRFPRVAVFASNPFLGELKAHLGGTTQHVLQAAVALDLTSFDGGELEHRVTEALSTSAPRAED